MQKAIPTIILESDAASYSSSEEEINLIEKRQTSIDEYFYPQKCRVATFPKM